MLSNNSIYKAGLVQAQHIVALAYEAGQGQEKDAWAPARASVVASIEAYLAYHHGAREEQLSAVLTKLRSGMGSRADYRALISLANISNESVKRIEAGDVPRAEHPSLELRLAMVKAYHDLLQSQGGLRTRWNELRQHIRKPAEPGPTLYRQAIAAERGDAYEIVIKRATQYPIRDSFGPLGGYDPPQHHQHTVAVLGAGANAAMRADMLAGTWHASLSLSSERAPRSEVRIGVRKVGAPDESIAWKEPVGFVFEDNGGSQR